MLLQNATEDLCARPHEDEIWNANTSHVALSPSLHRDYEPQLPEMSTPRTPWDTLLNLVLADAQESFAYKEKSNTSTEECYCLPATHTTQGWNLSPALQIIWELRAGCPCSPSQEVPPWRRVRCKHRAPQAARSA